MNILRAKYYAGTPQPSTGKGTGQIFPTLGGDGTYPARLLFSSSDLRSFLACEHLT